MAKKESIRRSLRQLRRIKTWQLVLILVLVAFVAATFLRLNNIGMVERRTAVLSADEQGDEEKMKERLYDLQRYVAAHMNANTGDVYLEKTIQRKNEAIREQARNAANTGGENIYKKVDDEICGPLARANNWRWPDARYISCLDTELAKYPEAQVSSGSVKLVSPDMYRHNFSSPLWSPDFAGFSVLLCLLILIVIILRLCGLLLLRMLLKIRYKGI